MSTYELRWIASVCKNIQIVEQRNTVKQTWFAILTIRPRSEFRFPFSPIFVHIRTRLRIDLHPDRGNPTHPSGDEPKNFWNVKYRRQRRLSSHRAAPGKSGKHIAHLTPAAAQPLIFPSLCSVWIFTSLARVAISLKSELIFTSIVARQSISALGCSRKKVSKKWWCSTLQWKICLFIAF